MNKLVLTLAAAVLAIAKPLAAQTTNLSLTTPTNGTPANCQ